MPKDLFTGSAHRVGVLSAAAVAVIAAAVLITIWRYEAAVSKADVAQDEAGEAASESALTAGRLEALVEDLDRTLQTGNGTSPSRAGHGRRRRQCRFTR